MPLSAILHPVVPNEAQHKGDTCVTMNAGQPSQYMLAIMEFDDQGLSFDRHDFTEIESQLQSLRDRFPIILVFAHGWRHNARPDDDNLVKFREVLAETARQQSESGGDRPVFGVFLGWRGLRTGLDAWEYLSFWDRHQAAQRVAHGSARELLGRLKAFRNTPSEKRPDGPGATLIIIGHSFGGLIVYTAIAQSLIEAAATSATVVPSFGDLVLLVNPAFSAVSYLPIYSIICAKTEGFDPTQLPVFVSVTAENDQATRDAFPAANLRLYLEEATIGSREHEALTRTMGHLDWLQTHELSASAIPSAAAALSPAARDRIVSLSSSKVEQSVGMVMVRRLDHTTSSDFDTQFGAPDSPFWVAKAKPQVVDGHNGIWTPPFESFVHDLVAAHIQKLG